MNEKVKSIKSVIMGHAVGDALGVPVEFCSREELDVEPVGDMRGYGTYPYPAGTWSDDTSMTLACLDSLANGIDYDDMMNKFCKWLENAEYTATGEVFDVGGTTRKSLLTYRIEKLSPLKCGQSNERDNGNGAVMRIAPVVLYLYYSKLNGLPMNKKIDYIENVSALTHAHKRSQIGCGIYAFILTELLQNKSKRALYNGIAKAYQYYKNNQELKHYSRIFGNDIALISRDKINGSGYVVDCLEAALWCLLTTDNYKDCVLKAVNLGEDTDTTAAVAGSLAGVLYGYDNIPAKWRDTLLRKDYIENLCFTVASKW